MSVSQVAHSGAGQSGWNTQIREVRREFHQLFKAVRTGDQVEQQAQTTTAALQQLRPADAVSSSGDSANVGDRTVGSVNSDLGALRQALRSGDTTAAQNLLTQLEQDVHSISLAPAHGSRHNHFGGMAPQVPSYPETPAAPVDASGDTTVPATTTEDPTAPAVTTAETAAPVTTGETAAPVGTTDETAAPVVAEEPAAPVAGTTSEATETVPAETAATPTETVPVPAEAAPAPVAEAPAAPATGEVVAAVPSGEPAVTAPSSEAAPATPDATVAVGTVPSDPLAAIISSIQQPEPVVVPDTPVIDTTA